MLNFRRTTIYAIIETGGKQYKVITGQTIEVDRLAVAEGSSIDLDKVLLIGDADKVTVGKPTIEGAIVKATSKGEKKGDKVIVGKFKSKVRYRLKKGHRQFFTTITIDGIVGPGVSSVKPEKATRKTSPRKKEVSEDGA
ncbi:50S ribosomal protein L21 [Chloroflexota bacterium]